MTPQDDGGLMQRTRSWAKGHRSIVIAAGVLTVVAAVFVLVWFQPHKLFIDDTVDEAFPIASASTTTTTVPPAPVPTTTASEQPSGGEVATTTTTTTSTTTTTTQPSSPRLLTEGEFIEVGHPGEGRAAVYRLPDGGLVLRFEDLDVTNGPDLRVILSPSPLVEDRDAYDDGDFLDLGVLKGNVGNQNYEIAADVDLSRYSTVAIWCRRFNYTFNAAPLTAVDP